MKKFIPSILVCLSLLTILTVGFVATAQKAEAIPAFARKYRMSCTTCHAPVPRLKAYGDDFAGAGFVLADQDAPRYTVETGDDDLDLIREFPIAARLEGYVKHETATDHEVDLSLPYNLKLLSGGALTKNIAYYFYFFLSERGEVAGVEDAYVMFNDVGGIDFDIYLGQFQVSDPLFKREVRLTYEDYEVYKYSPGETAIDLKYDRGVMMTLGIENGPDVIVEILNGNGIGEAGDDHAYDDDKYKCGVLRLSQDLSDYFRLGGFGYFGAEGETASKNEVTMYGADATLGNEKLELNFQYVHREDDNPWLRPNDSALSIKGEATMAELIFMPQGERSKWYAVGLYNWVDQDGPADPLYHAMTAHVGYMVRTNVRAFVENTYYVDAEENRFVFGLMTAF